MRSNLAISHFEPCLAPARRSQKASEFHRGGNPNTVRNFVTFLACALFVSLLFAPTLHTIPKGFVVIVLTTVALLKIATTGGRIDREVLVVSSFMIGVGMLGVAVGAVNGTAGWLRCSTVNVLWPSVFTLFAFAIDGKMCKSLASALVLGGTLAGLYLILFALVSVGIWPTAFFFEIQPDQVCAYYGGWIESNLTNISTLIFATPFAISAFLETGSQFRVATKRRVLLMIVATALASIVTGRRALWVVILLAIPMAFAMRSVGGRTRIARLGLAATVLVGIVACCGAALSHFAGLDLQVVVGEFCTVFDITDNESNLLRVEQFHALISGWQQSPLLGEGAGAACEGLIRDSQMPWAYELTYVAVLFQGGLVAFLAYAFGIMWIVARGAEVARNDPEFRPQIIPLLVGMIAFLAANASNPYLQKFDFMWVVFLPVWVINASRLRRFGNDSQRLRNEFWVKDRTRVGRAVRPASRALI